jgi:hypothetical protein
MMTQELSIPQILRVAQIARRATQITPYTLLDARVQDSWAARPLNLLQAGKTALLKAMDPVLYGSRTVPEKFCDFGAAVSRAYQENTMKLMIIS